MPKKELELFVKNITKTEKKEATETKTQYKTKIDSPDESITIQAKEVETCSFDVGDKWILQRTGTQQKLD